MKTILLAAFLIPLLAFASKKPGETLTNASLGEDVPNYLVKYKRDKTLKAGQAKVTFVCDLCEGQTLQYSINGSSEKTTMNIEGKSSFILTPKKGVFQFYIDSSYEEIMTDSIRLKEGMETIITLNFVVESEFRVIALKPVIYIYTPTATNVSVTVNPVGKFRFTYPEYKNIWNVIAQPNGNLELEGKTYLYLFWEADLLLSDPFSDHLGFIVKKENVIAFLEEKLTTLGLNAKEQTDFITFWGPQLAVHDQCKVTFIINDQCTIFADLIFSPAPDHVNRVYIAWSPAESTEKLTEQQLPSMNRDGFDILEWGGVKIPSSAFSQFNASTH